MKKIIFILIFLMVLPIGFSFSLPELMEIVGTQIGIIDDYLVYDDFEDGIIDTTKYSWDELAPVSSSIYRPLAIKEEQGKLFYHPTCLSDVGCGIGTFYLLDNWKGKYLKITADTIPYCVGGKNRGGSQIVWIVNGANYAGFQSSGFCGGHEGTSTLEIIQRILEPDNYDIYVNNKYQGTYKGDIKVSINGGFILDEIRFKYPFDCKKEDYEVIIREKYTPNSVVDIKNLKFAPTKMCPDFAPIFLSDKGVQSIPRGELFYKISRGVKYTIPPTLTYGGETHNIQYLIFEYITPYVEGMKERCQDPAYAYDTKLEKCVQRIEQVAPKEVILQCKEDNNCNIGLSGRCGKDITWQCINNSCKYFNTDCEPEQIINELIVYKTQTQIIKQYEELKENEFVWYHNYQSPQEVDIFGELLDAGIPKYIENCNQINNGYVNDQKCFEQVLGGLALKPYQKEYLNDYVWVIWNFNGNGVKYKNYELDGMRDEITGKMISQYNKEEDWGGIFKFTFKKFIDLLKPTDSYYLKLNSEHNLNLELNNKLGTTKGGIIATFEPQLVQQDRITKDYQYTLNNGINNIKLPIYTEQQGVLNVLIEPYVTVTTNKEYKFFTGDKLLISYNVVSGEIPDEWEITEGVVTEEKKPLKIPTFVWVIAGFLFILWLWKR